MNTLTDWLCLLPFVLAYAIALPVLFLAGRDAWREMRSNHPHVED